MSGDLFEMRAAILIVLAIFSGRGAFGQVTATQPASPEVIRSADDFASRAFQDPWDMNQRTDLGTFTYGVDLPPSGLGPTSIAGGVFSATSVNDDPNFWLLDTGNPYAAKVGKIGTRFPVVSSKYRRLVMRLSLTGAGISAATPGWGHIHWSNHTIYPENVPPGGINTSNVFTTRPGWWIYSLNMQTLGTAAGAAWTAADVDSLRVDPFHAAGASISLDWARLVEDVPALYRTIQWSGSGAVDIFLDNDRNSANGLLGQIAHNATGNSFPFYVGGLPQGTYNVVISPTGAAGPYSYAPGNWQIQDIPLLSFTSPSPDGSSDDFATTRLNNPWDMDALTDIDLQRNVTGRQIANIPAEDEQGNSLGTVRVLQGASAATSNPWGDPHLYPFWYQARGANTSIDTSYYRILSLEMGIAGDRDINRGSIARIVWQNTGGTENVSDDIILNHRSGANVIQKLTLDMKSLALDPNSNTSKAGWTGLVNSFRVDPHEFPEARTFWIKSVRLTALERAASTYTVRWSYNGQGAAGVTLSLYYDTTGTGFGGAQIASGLDPSTGAYDWNVSAVPAGTYYIYGVFRIGGAVVNQAYAAWPLLINMVGATPSTLALGRSRLSFGSTASGANVTPPQEVLVEVKGSPVSWSVTSNQPWLVVSPASGTGSGRFRVSVQTAGIPAPASTEGTLTVTAAGAVNSPLSVRVILNTLATGASSSPFGAFDTPTDNPAGLGGSLAVSGSIAVTGWALDDVGVKQLGIWRDPVGSEPRHSNGYVYIGDAFFVPGARPDVEAIYPASPQAYRAGWGYMLLTNPLPGNGNGTFKLHAIAVDKDGHQFRLGAKTVVVNNLQATKPFGALDNPAPGQTVSGIFVNDGWALTPPPAAIPADGSTIWVNVDGVNLAHPVFGLNRADITGLFPGYANTNSSAGSFYLDTTAFSNAMHTIAWIVYDNQGRGDGIGSRFFTVQNGASAAVADPGAVAPEAFAQRAFQLQTARLYSSAAPAASYPAFRRGYDADAPLTPVRQAGEGILEPIEVKELDRVEIHLPGGRQWTAGLRHGDELRALPIGSTFDAGNGIFYWQLGPAFLGEFALEFRSAEGALLPVTVRVGAHTVPTAIQ
jgi:hypothetical protein